MALIKPEAVPATLLMLALPMTVFLVLMYQRRPGPELQSTLAVSFVVGLLMSLIALSFADRVREEHVILAFQLLPGLLVGL